MDNQLMAMWEVLTSTQKEDQILILGASPTAKNELVLQQDTMQG